jgi:hypothetical protein
MRVGVFGPDGEAQCQAVARAVGELGATPVLIRGDALEAGRPMSSLDGAVRLEGVDLEQLDALYVRSVPSPWAPLGAPEPALTRYEDWFIRSMQARERASFELAWLQSLEDRGVRCLNSPRALAELEYPAHRLAALRRAGAPVPRTLISNDPDAVRAFLAEVPGVVVRSLMGDAPATEPPPDAPLELAAPTLFQQRLDGDLLHVTLVGEDARCAVALPDEVVQRCRAVGREAGLPVAGLQLVRTRDAGWVFVDVDAAPTLDAEASRAVAKLLVAHR